MLIALAPESGQAFTLYVGDALGNPVKPCIPIDEDANQGNGFPTVTHHLWFDAGSVPTTPASAACDGTGGTNPGQGTDVCMYDLHLVAGPGITIEAVTDVAPGLVRTPDLQLSSGVLRINAGDPLLGQRGIHEIAQLLLASSANDSVMLEGVMSVNTDLVGNPLGPGVPLLHSGVDTDQDGLCDKRDPCPDFANTITGLATTGIPPECLCGDADGNGFITSADLIGINVCVQNNALCDQDLVDADVNGFTTSVDIIATNAVVNGAPPYTLRCARRPTGFPPETDLTP
jgi:hypothetical protein